MASSSSPWISSYLFLLLVLFSCFCSQKGYGVHGREPILESQFDTVEISSLLPSSVCTRSTVPINRQSTVEVLHRHGPCYKDASALTRSQILSADESRVKYIHKQLSSEGKNELVDEKVTLPARSGTSYNSGNYVVTIGLGTPTRSLSVIFDTGSYVSWTQCRPCSVSCHRQLDPLFDPSASASYSNVSCGSPQCAQLSSAGSPSGCSKATCLYGVVYGDQSFTVGFYAKDKLTLSSDVFNNFLFGCGQNNQGLFGSTAGLLGLGPSSLSLVSQTAPKYGKVFSYCLPATSSSTGHLTFGSSAASRNVQYTPFDASKGRSFYYISITGISVGGIPLSIKPGVFGTSGTIIDSGTVITRLPPDAYSALSSAFKRLMSQRYKISPAFSILDTCFDVGGSTIIQVPKVSFTFKGNVVVQLPASGTLYVVDRSKVCLAFAGNSVAGSIAIWGNKQQRGFELVHDVAAGRLGIGAGAC